MATRTAEQLLADVTFALERDLGARDLVPMLEQLVSRAAAGSDVSRFARLQLGRQLLEKNPFRAAALARSVLLEEEGDEAFGLLGLALTLLGHFRAAATAHRRACRLRPGHPGHAHNLGHLLDVGFAAPRRALPWLERAFRDASDVPEIASSYAHALLGVGRVDAARRVLVEHALLTPSEAEATVSRWLSPPSTANSAGE